MDKVPFRQVHLDFHTSESIPGIGCGFDKEEFKRTLKEGHVNSITLFSKCHHGYSYHPTHANIIHPGLNFNLLQEQIDACKEIGVRTPVYISAGLDQKTAKKHPEWLLKGNPNSGHDFLNHAGYKVLCFNSPYLDELLSEIEEVMIMFNPTEVFLDICNERVCYCNYCLEDMRKNGLDPHNQEDAVKWSKIVYKNYCDKVEKVIRKYNNETVIFHNAGNIPMGRRDFAAHDNHLELESLPTGGWGYDHFPMSASYVRNLGMEYIGMTGKFHTTWGEFGGFKHPNALIYETSLSIALGAKCSIGDQLHPCGILNPSTYRLIGKAYELVEKKEQWCNDVKNIADIAIFSAFSVNGNITGSESLSDTGANRILLEKKYLYDIIDKDCDFKKYKLIIFPDCVECDSELANKINEYLESNGKMLISGNSCKDCVPGINITREREYSPDYMHPVSETGFTNGITEYVMYTPSFEFTHSKKFKVIAYSVNPFFNRTPEHFSSHQHTPDKPGTLHPLAILSENIGYINHRIFEDYAVKGELHCKELVDNMIDALIGNEKTINIEGLPDRGIVTLQNQECENRLVNHLLYAHTTVRGKGIEVIEDVVPVSDIKVSIKTGFKPKSVKLVPENKDLKFTYSKGEIKYTVPKLYIHQMVEIKK